MFPCNEYHNMFYVMSSTICFHVMSTHNMFSCNEYPNMIMFDHEIFSTVILSLLLIQEGQLSVSGERMCTILVNRLAD